MTQEPKHHDRATSGLENVLEMFEMRYEYDGNGRIARVLGDGVLPRFVLGRSIEGCLWRFSTRMDSTSVAAVARLAGRDLGSSALRFDPSASPPPPPPERLVMIERLLASHGDEPRTEYETLTTPETGLLEIWTLY